MNVAITSLQPHEGPGPVQFRRRGNAMERILPKANPRPASRLVQPPPFDEWWERLRKTVLPGTKVYHWSAFSSHQLDGDFTLAGITDREVIIENPNWRIPREHFEVIFPHWRDYARGATPRSALSQQTWSTTYIFSIMHLHPPKVGQS
jgi:hypothetical protein